MLLLIPLIGGYFVTFLNIFLSLIKSYKEQWHFISGLIGGIILSPLLNRQKFLRTFEHEMTHLLFAKIFFGKIKALNVNSNGEGYVEYSASPNPFIGLSPYFFPLFSAFVSILIPLLNPVFSKYFFILSGIFLSNHLISSLKEILSSQPDIKQEGIVFSAFFISFFIIFFYGIIVSEPLGLEKIIFFIKDGFSKSISNLFYIKNLLITFSK